MTSRRNNQFSRIASAVAVLVGATVLLGWLLEVPALKGVLPGMLPMRVNTAVCFILTGVALWLTEGPGRPGAFREVHGQTIIQVCAALVLLVNGLRLLELSSGWNLGIDEVLFRHASASAATARGRMAPNTAVGFMVITISLLLLQGRPGRLRLAGAGLLGAFTVLLGSFTVLGYLGIATVGEGWARLTTMALPAGLVFVLLGLVCVFRTWRSAGLQWSISRNLLAGFVLGLGIFIVLGLYSYKSVRQLVEAADSVRRVSDLGVTPREVWFMTFVPPLGMFIGLVLLLVVLFHLNLELTERKRAEQRRAMEQAVISILVEGRPMGETIGRILKLICGELDWDIGAFWQMDRPTRALRCVEICHPPSTEFVEFVKATRQLTLPTGVGLPGWVWVNRKPKWISDTAQDHGYQKARMASRVGLSAAFAFPVRLGDEPLGVLEFFSAQIREPDEEMLAMFHSVGSRIGQFIDRSNLEEQLRQSQKMDAIGTLAGGIAHDFNNILTAIHGYTEIALLDSADYPVVTESLDEVLSATHRATDLVRQILAFSRREGQQRVPTQLGPLVEEALKLLRATIPSMVQFKSSLRNHAPTVLADPSQIHQVVMNLCTNASHAMKDRPGCLGISLETINVTDGVAQIGLIPGVYAHLSFTDTGIGMDQPTIDHIFEPFFTTKGPGEGTGLGLSVVHGIVKSHHGTIAVNSRPGEGTTFDLYFPAHAGASTEVRVTSPAIPRGNGEQVLLVDDEEALVALGRKMLERLGYRVEIRTNAEAAMKLVRDDPARFDLVITDLTMPGMTGIDFAKQLLMIRPDLPIILNTGYSAGLTSESVREFGIRELLLKPLGMETLGTAVHRALAEPKKNNARH